MDEHLVELAPKRQGETKFYTFDFTNSMASAETVSTQVCTAEVYSGTDASPSSIVSGSATASGKVISQKFTAGVFGVIYYITCTITTSLGQTLIRNGFLAIY